MKGFECMTIDFCNLDITNMRVIPYFITKLGSNIETLVIRNMNTEMLLSTEYMFVNNKYLKLIDLGNMNTDNISSMYGMFKNCKSLEKIIMKSSSTWRLINVGEMFNFCGSLTDIDLPAIIPDGSSIYDMTYMFSGCKSLKKLNLSTMNISGSTVVTRAFSWCMGLSDKTCDLIRPSNKYSWSRLKPEIDDKGTF